LDDDGNWKAKALRESRHGKILADPLPHGTPSRAGATDIHRPSTLGKPRNPMEISQKIRDLEASGHSAKRDAGRDP